MPLYFLECFIMDADSVFFLAQYDIAELSGIASAFYCQESCNAKADCKYFVYADKGFDQGKCWLKSKRASKLNRANGQIFGAKLCSKSVMLEYYKLRCFYFLIMIITMMIIVLYKQSSAFDIL